MKRFRVDMRPSFSGLHAIILETPALIQRFAKPSSGVLRPHPERRRAATHPALGALVGRTRADPREPGRDAEARNRTPRPPYVLASPSAISSTPADSIALINFTSESTVPRITPSLASIR